MNKLLKKHRQWIMVGGGVLLMTAWLLPQGLGTLQDERRRVVATIDGSKVRGLAWTQNGQMYNAVKALVQLSAGRTRRPTLESLEALGCTNAEHFLLLREEARREGMIGGKADVEEAFEKVTDTVAMEFAMADLQNKTENAERANRYFSTMMGGMDPNLKPEEQEARAQAVQYYRGKAQTEGVEMMRLQIREKTGISAADLETAIAEYRGIVRMFNTYIGSPRLSDRRVIATARRLGETTTADYVLVGADRLASRVPEPTAEEITTHYEKYKNVAPGTGEFGIGYRMPERVKLEWIEVNKLKVASAIKLIDTHVRERWNARNPGKPPADFAATREAFETELRNQYAEEVIKLVDVRYREIAGEANRAYKVDGKFRKLPEDWRDSRLTMKKLADAIVAGVKTDTSVRDDAERWQSPIILPELMEGQETGWLTADQVQALSGLGTATLARGSLAGLAFPQVALSARELKPATDVALQVGVLPVFDRPVADIAGNHYYFRVTAVRPAGEPESIDEVREKVILDIKRIRAYDLLKTEIEKAATASMTGGLEAVATTFSMQDNAALTVKPVEPLVIHRGARIDRLRVQLADRAATEDAKTLDVPAFREAVVSKADAIDAKLEIATQPAAARTVWTMLPGSLSAVVARIEKIAPITVEFVRQNDAGIINRSVQDELGEVTEPLSKTPFTFAALKTRLKYQSLMADRKE